MEFHQLKVSHIERLTKDSVRVDLFPVQYGETDFNFRAGQYLTFEAEIGDEKIRRSYSLCSSPDEDVLSVGIKEVPEGRFSTFANRILKAGDILYSAIPNGNFTNEKEGNPDNNFVYFAAGSGITPILSMMKSTLQKSSNSTLTLFYGNKNIRSIMFLEALEALKNQFMGRVKIYHILSQQAQDSPLFAGRINKEKLDEWDSCFSIEETDSFFMCGPEAMILDLTEGLMQRGVSKEQIHFELFTSDAGEEARKKRRIVEHESESKKAVNVKLDGKMLHIQFGKDDDNILDKALEIGADLPFACKGGVCCTCKAKLIQGKVDMYVNYGLEPDEIDRGFILTCQSYPITDVVTVSFDEV